MSDEYQSYGADKQDYGPVDTQSFEQRSGEMFNPSAGDLPQWMQNVAKAPPSLTDQPKQDSGGLDTDVLAQLEHAQQGLMEEQRGVNKKMIGEIESGRQDMAGLPVPQLGKQPQAPRAEMGQGLMEYMQVVSVLSALAGGLARRNGTVALTAFAGAVKGFVEGRKEDFNAKIEEWKTASEQLKADNQAKLDQYDLTLKNKKMSMDMKLNELKIISSQYSDEIMYNLAAQKQYVQIAQLNQREKEFQANYDLKTQALQNTIEKTQAQIKEMEGAQSDAIDNIAGFMIQGAPAPPGLARNKQMLTQVNNRLAQMMQEQGLTPQDLINRQMQYRANQREATAVGQRGGTIAIAVQDAKNMIPLASGANAASAREGKRNGIAAWNNVTNEWDVQKGDRNFAQFVVYTNSLINIYARAQGGGGSGTVEQREHARQMLNPNENPQAYAASLQAMQNDLAQMSRAPGQVRQQLFPPGGGGGGGGDVIKYDAQGNRVQ